MDGGVSAHRVSNTDGLLDFQLREHGCQVLSKSSPAVWRRGLTAAAMSARVDRDTKPAGKPGYGLIPGARVKAGRMAQNYGRQITRPLPDNDGLTVYRESDLVR
jgi:hypothetical protein